MGRAGTWWTGDAKKVLYATKVILYVHLRDAIICLSSVPAIPYPKEVAAGGLRARLSRLPRAHCNAGQTARR